ncbi:collagen alpha-1(I) chain-like [Equus caballus]|uniref:collagen alpha-1(I) chain-like n=1 Tax=Equus caballus TaxID=9796 RepID=UPI0038B27AEE
MYGVIWLNEFTSEGVTDREERINQQGNLVGRPAQRRSSRSACPTARPRRLRGLTPAGAQGRSPTSQALPPGVRTAGAQAPTGLGTERRIPAARGPPSGAAYRSPDSALAGRPRWPGADGVAPWAGRPQTPVSGAAAPADVPFPLVQGRPDPLNGDADPMSNGSPGDVHLRCSSLPPSMPMGSLPAPRSPPSMCREPAAHC